MSNGKLAPTHFFSGIGKKLLAIWAISLNKKTLWIWTFKLDKIKLLPTQTVFYSVEQRILAPMGEIATMVKIQLFLYYVAVISGHLWLSKVIHSAEVHCAYSAQLWREDPKEWRVYFLDINVSFCCGLNLAGSYVPRSHSLALPRWGAGVNQKGRSARNMR